MADAAARELMELALFDGAQSPSARAALARQAIAAGCDPNGWARRTIEAVPSKDRARLWGLDSCVAVAVWFSPPEVVQALLDADPTRPLGSPKADGPAIARMRQEWEARQHQGRTQNLTPRCVDLLPRAVDSWINSYQESNQEGLPARQQVVVLLLSAGASPFQPDALAQASAWGQVLDLMAQEALDRPAPESWRLEAVADLLGLLPDTVLPPPALEKLAATRATCRGTAWAAVFAKRALEAKLPAAPPTAARPHPVRL